MPPRKKIWPADTSPNRVRCTYSRGHWAFPEDFDTKSDGTRNQQCRLHLKVELESRTRGKTLGDESGEELRCTDGRGHWAPRDDFDIGPDGKRRTVCKKHVQLQKQAQERSKATKSGTIMEEDGPHKGEKRCARRHWAPITSFDFKKNGKPYKTCRFHRNQEQFPIAKIEEDGLNAGMVRCSRKHWRTAEEFGPLVSPVTGKPYKRCADCRRKSRERQMRDNLKEKQRVASFSEEERSRYCPLCHRLKASLEDFTRLSGKTHRVKVSNTCNDCHYRLIEYKNVDGIRCLHYKSGCKEIFPTEEARAAHAQNECEFTRHCHNCGAKLRKEEKDGHQLICPSRVCGCCSLRIPLDEVQSHKRTCYQKLGEMQAALEAKGHCIFLSSLSSTLCDMDPFEEFSFCEKHISQGYGTGQNSAGDKKKLLGIFFSERGRSAIWTMKQTPIGRTIDQFAERMRSRPHSVILGDTEFLVGARPLPHPVTQAALFSGASQEIAPVKTIDHCMTKLQLFESAKCARLPVAKSTFVKFYGLPNGKQTSGPDTETWEKIAERIERFYIRLGLQPEDCVFGEWSLHNLDYKNIQGGLASVGKGRLLPALPSNQDKRVDLMRWWSKFRSALGLKQCRGQGALHLGLNLGNLYSIIHPEDKEMLKGQHNADVDTKMLIAVTQFFLKLWKDKIGPERIEWYIKTIEEADQKSKTGKKDTKAVTKRDVDIFPSRIECETSSY